MKLNQLGTLIFKGRNGKQQEDNSKMGKELSGSDYDSDKLPVWNLSVQDMKTEENLSQGEGSRCLAFVPTSENDWMQFIDWYRERFHSESAVKENVMELNCAYGVKSDELFLVGLDANAEKMNLDKWDTMSFIGILYRTGEIFEVRCKGKETNGTYEIDYKVGSVQQNWELIRDGILYYRNPLVRKHFFDNYQREFGEHVESRMYRTNQEMLARMEEDNLLYA